MTTLHLREYKVSLLADGDRQTITVLAAGKRQAGTTAAKQARTLLGARTVEIKRVVEVKHRPLA